MKKLFMVVVACAEQFLADDFLGVDTDGTLYDKAKAISDTKHDFKDYAYTT